MVRSGIFNPSSFIIMGTTIKIDAYCLQCGELLPAATPHDQLYCSTACHHLVSPHRVTPHRVSPHQVSPPLAPVPTEPEEETVSPPSQGLDTLLWLGGILGGAWVLGMLTPPAHPRPNPGLRLRGLDAYAYAEECRLRDEGATGLDSFVSPQRTL